MAVGRSRPCGRIASACRSRRGAKGRNDRIFLEALHDFAVHNITWRALPEAFGIWMGDRWRSTSQRVRRGDSPQFEILLDLGPDITPRAAVGDKGYDGQSNRTAARERGICPVIPFKLSARNRPAFFPKALYRARRDRGAGRQAQALQAHRPPLRENEQELRHFRRFRPRPHHRQIRPQGLGSDLRCALSWIGSTCEALDA
jgi:hypothetical protein